jgi:hypothetical protein
VHASLVLVDGVADVAQDVPAVLLTTATAAATVASDDMHSIHDEQEPISVLVYASD